MRYLNLLAIVIFLLPSSNNFAQTPQQIEADLLKSFKKIEYWDQQRDKDTSFSWTEKLSRANYDFAQKLQFYAQKFPATIKYPFNLLVKRQLDISSSTDGLFRIYSWDTETGGTMHFFENVMQFKSNALTNAIIDTSKEEGDNRPNYRKMYTLYANGKSFYITTYLDIGSSKDIAEGIHIFTIENGKLQDANLIKTYSGFLNDLSYSYDFWSVMNIDYDKRPRIRFDKTTNTIYLPMIDRNLKMTKKFIRYKFIGQYFERIKN